MLRFKTGLMQSALDVRIGGGGRHILEPRDGADIAGEQNVCPVQAQPVPRMQEAFGFPSLWCPPVDYKKPHVSPDTSTYSSSKTGHRLWAPISPRLVSPSGFSPTATSSGAHTAHGVCFPVVTAALLLESVLVTSLGCDKVHHLPMLRGSAESAWTALGSLDMFEV